MCGAGPPFEPDAVQQKELVAIGIALQTQVLKSCPVHGELHFDDENNMGRAFSLAGDLGRQLIECVGAFRDDGYQLTDVLSDILGRAPAWCPRCYAQPRQTRGAGAGTFRPSGLSIEVRASH